MNKTCKKYARALFESYEPKSLKEKSLALCSLAEALSANEDFLNFFRNPSISLENKEKIGLEISELIAPADKFMANFIRLLIENSVISQVCGIAESFRILVSEWEKCLELQVTFANTPSEEEKNDLLLRLKNEFGNSVSVDWQINPELIGGFTVKSGDRLLDSSVAGSLEKIRKNLIA